MSNLLLTGVAFSGQHVLRPLWASLKTAQKAREITHACMVDQLMTEELLADISIQKAFEANWPIYMNLF